MSMLSEQRRKTKWVINPMKKPLWSTDSSGIKFGKQLMEKMGWSAGKGLGLKEQGIQEPLRVSFKNDTKGMGFKGNDDDWIEHQDEFNSLLSQLRGDDDSTDTKDSTARKSEIKSLEEKSKRSKTRVHYQKFTRGKDLSKYSENDLACILGTGKTKKKKQKIVEVDERESKTDVGFETSFGVTTINSGSINDYFKKKWTIGKTKSFNSIGDNNDRSEFSVLSFSNNESFFSAQEDSIKFEKIDEERKSLKKTHKPKTEEGNEEESSRSDSGKLDNIEKIGKKRKKKNEGKINSDEPKHKKKRKQGNDTSADLVDLLCENYINMRDDENLEKEKDNIVVKKQKKALSLVTMEITNDKYSSGEESSSDSIHQCVSSVGEIKDLIGEVKFKEKSVKTKERRDKKEATEMSDENNSFKKYDNLEVEIPGTQNGTDLTDSCLEIKTVKQKKKKKEKFEVQSENSFGDLIQDFSEAVQDMEKLNSNLAEREKNYKNNKKEKLKQKKDYDENYTLSNQEVPPNNSFERIPESVPLEKKKKKKDKKDKLDENMFSNLFIFEGIHTKKNEKGNVLEESVKKKKKKEKEKNCEAVQKDFEPVNKKNEKKKMKENVKELGNEGCVREQLEELSERKMENKVNLSDSFNLTTDDVNSFIKSEGEKRIERLKPNLFEDTVAQKYFPQAGPSEKVLRLIKWANINEFKGANLKNIEGYGRRKMYEKKSR